MDSLRPDRDDLDLYNSRKNKNKNSKASSAKAGGKGTPQAAETRNVGDLSSKVRSELSQDYAAAQAVPVVAAPKSSPLVALLLVLMIAALGGLSYLYWEQSQTVVSLENRLSSADEFIGQSKLLLARLEGEVSETGAELLQTGTSAEKKLAFLESEVRKLWGVSYDRNRKALQEQEKKLEALGNDLAANKKAISSQGKSLSAVQSDIKKGLSVLDGRVASLSGEMSITRAEQDESLTALVQKLEGFEGQISGLEARVKTIDDKTAQSAKKQLESQESLSSIDESRRQLIKRIVDLEARLAKLSAASAGGANRLP